MLTLATRRTSRGRIQVKLISLISSGAETRPAVPEEIKHDNHYHTGDGYLNRLRTRRLKCPTLMLELLDFGAMLCLTVLTWGELNSCCKSKHLK